MKTRLDAELVRRELARSREQAADLIESRSVLVNGIPATKPATQLDAETSIVLAGKRDDFVSRGGHKLAGALEAFSDVVVEGKVCLDAGASTGGFTDVLLRQGAKKVIAVDLSKSMIQRTKKITLEDSTLTQAQKDRIEFREGNLLDAGIIKPGEITHAICLYFVIYYMRDIEAFFRNMFVWVRPGGMMAIEVVNKYKFDPMLESASPFVAFSMQKYAKERIRKSEVNFDGFKYEGVFDLFDPVAEFRETFRFKDGSVRRQKHILTMPAISEIVSAAQVVGWKYDSYVDLTAVGFEYAYLLLFTHP